MKNNKLFFKIYIPLLIIISSAAILFSVLGNKPRIGYLSEFKFDISHINRTLELNNLSYIKELFTKDRILDEEGIKNYIFTNESITNYSYGFKVQYYDKVFRHSDIYNVYIDTNKVLKDNDFIEEINIYKGNPFGNLISSEKIESDKIDNVKYTLKLKASIIILLIILYSILILYILLPLIIKLIFPIMNYIIEFFNNFFDKHIKVHKFNTVKDLGSNNIYIAAFLIFFPFIFIFYESIYSSVPYYRSWDSSQIYAKDILLVSSNLFPEHLLHPNMIPLVLYKYIFIPIGNIFKIISASNITELENSLNPYLSFVEFTEYILMICRSSFFLFITIMYINIIRVMQIQNIVKNRFVIFIFSLSLLIILSMSKFVFDTGNGLNTVIRYEGIGLLLASISLYFVISSSNTDNLCDNKHKLLLILSGIFVGAAVLSKIMIAGWIIGIFIIYILLNLDKYFYYNEDKNIGNISNILIFITIFVILINIFIPIAIKNDMLLSSAFINVISKNLLIYSQIITPVFFIILSVITFMVKHNIIRTNGIEKILLNNFILYVLSCFLTILFSLLLPMAFNSLLTTYIFSYAGGSIMAFVGGSSIYSSYTKKALFGVILIIILSSFLFTYIIKNKKVLFKNIVTINFMLNIILIIFSLVFIIALRNGGADRLITVSLFIFSIFLLIRYIFNILPNIKIFKYILFIILFIISIKILITNIHSQYYTPVNSDYVYDIDMWKTFSYGKDNGIRFVNLFFKNYNSDESWNYAVYWSRNVKQVRQLLAQIEVTNNSLNDTIIACNNSKISKDSKSIISNIDNNINGGLILALKDNVNKIYLRLDYDFYFISDIEYKKLYTDNRVQFTDYDFYINNQKYFVYKLNMDSSGMKFNFIKNEDFNTGFILINDRLSKGL